MYNLHLSAEQLEFRDTVRGFFAQGVRQAEWFRNLWERRSSRLLRGLLSNSAPAFGSLSCGRSEVSIGAACDHRQNALDS